jgi:plasmid stability protein
MVLLIALFILSSALAGEMGSDTNLSLSMALISLKSLIRLAASTETEITPMASITIRNLDDEIKQRLRVRAAERGHSMEEEARDILRRVTSEGSAPRNLAAAIRARVAPADRVDLALPAREPMREPPQFT